MMGLTGCAANEDPKTKGSRLGSSVIHGPGNEHNREITFITS